MNAMWIKVLALGMLALALVGGTWKVHDWKDGHDQNAATQAEAKAAAEQHLKLNASNEETAKRMAALMTTMEGQAHAFAQLDAYLAAHPMGSCHFDGVSDGLWTGAYDAAFGAHQAGGVHAPARPAATAAQPHEPAHR